MSRKISIEKYISADLFKDLAMENLSPEERIAFLDAFGEVIQQRIVLRLAKELSDEQKKAFEKLMSEKPNDDQAFAEFLVEKIPQFPQLISDEVAEYKRELINRARA